MSGIEVEVLREGDLTRLFCRGEASVEGYRQVTDRLRKEMAGAPNGARVYVDLLGVEGMLDEMDKFFLGEYVAEGLKGLKGLRIAVRMREGDITKFGENTVVNRGVDLLVSHDPDELAAWLKG